MSFSKDFLSKLALALLVPIGSALIVMYSDIQTLKETKAEHVEVVKIEAALGKQMALNTQAIQNLDTTLGKFILSIEKWRKDDGRKDE